MLRLLLCGFFFMAGMSAPAQENFASDVFKTTGGELKITFIGHGSLLFTYQDRTIYIDPFGSLADFNRLPKAARSFKPRILYPYHYSNSDPRQLVDLLKADTAIDVRIRKM